MEVGWEFLLHLLLLTNALSFIEGGMVMKRITGELFFLRVWMKIFSFEVIGIVSASFLHPFICYDYFR